MRRDWTDQQLAPFALAVAPLESLSFSAAVSEEAWRQLAIVLAEEGSGPEHAERIVEAFIRTPRYDERQMLRTDVPSSIELRMFAREIPRVEVPTGGLPPACPECEPYEGAWRIVTTASGDEATARCVCPRGLALRARAAAHKKNTPKARVRSEGFTPVFAVAGAWDILGPDE